MTKATRALNGVEDAAAGRYDHYAPAWDRAETDPCERGTVGCCVRHAGPAADADCETW